MINSKIMWGTHAGVRVIGEGICEKTYTEYTLTSIKDHVIDRDLFNKIKELNLNTFVKLLDYKYSMERKQILSYTMEYYPPFGIDIMNIDTSYIINSFENIYNDILILTKNNILIGDMNFSNIIFGDIIKVIDFDNYKLSTLSFDEIMKNNINQLCFCFKDNYKNALYYEYSRSGYIHYSMENLLKLFNPEERVVECMKKKLLRYERPIDFFKDNSKG